MVILYLIFQGVFHEASRGGCRLEGDGGEGLSQTRKCFFSVTPSFEKYMPESKFYFLYSNLTMRYSSHSYRLQEKDKSRTVITRWQRLVM